MSESPDSFVEQSLLQSLLEGTSAEIGHDFFRALVKNLSQALSTHGAWLTEYLPEERRLRAIAFWLEDGFVENFEYAIADTPCELVVEEKRLVHIPENVIELYPKDKDLPPLNAVGYIGVPLLDTDGTILGHLALLDNKPLPQEERVQTVFRIFANRGAAELQRLRAEQDVRQREEKLSLMVSSAMDAIIELDAEMTILSVNAAVEKTLRCKAHEVIGKRLTDLFDMDEQKKFLEFVRQLASRPSGEQYLWFPDGLKINRNEGGRLYAEATISRFEVRNEPRYTMILRDIEERLAAERKIASLTAQQQYLQQEVREIGHFGDILGQSASILRVLGEVQQVASTNASVLILGETGTGKELIARAIHTASPRRDGPLVRVNCAAIPASLIESEFFGHEKGAFTGATQRRPGRFTLADGGSIFLDEVGEIPIDLQAKLLRVLQEGEFEPVGSSDTIKVNVRVIAATNRDLLYEIQEGRFREDLYYRINVFPLTIPPLRERGEDIILLANHFARKFAAEIGREILPISPECVRRLKAYDWPGNIRELQNVMERAVITARDGHLNLERTFPESAPDHVADFVDSSSNGDRIYTAVELERLERANIIRALEASEWRVSGKDGAAERLGLKPTTLSSRIKALGIRRSS